MQSIQSYLERAMELHVGLRPGLLSKTLVQDICTEISNKYYFLSFEDLVQSYEQFDIDVSTWRSPTKKQILEPIVRWVNAKEEVRRAYEKHLEAGQYELERVEKEREFELEAIDMYKKSDFEYIGTPFHADVIAKKYFRKALDQERKNELWVQAKSIKKVNDEKADDQFINPNFGVSAERIFAKLVVDECLVMGVEIGLVLRRVDNE